MLQEILSKLQQGLRLTPPEGTPKAVHKEIMVVCWDMFPKQRLTFQDIVIKLRDIIGKLPKNRNFVFAAASYCYNFTDVGIAI